MLAGARSPEKVGGTLGRNARGPVRERPYLDGGGSRIAGYRYAALEFRDSTRILLQATPRGKYGGIEW